LVGAVISAAGSAIVPTYAFERRPVRTIRSLSGLQRKVLQTRASCYTDRSSKATGHRPLVGTAVARLAVSRDVGENKLGSLDGRDVAALPRDAWFPRPARGNTRRVMVAASTVAVVAIAAAVIVVAAAAWYILPRGGRRRRTRP